ncbi:prolipoprotein diacylglyceryl transferase [Sedimentibacter sp.]|uniref:prolipoprotein diacylglyceryl transferase n=1 Tax=Sedimentibacter sp. TaxID=1960295 RepID=UPI00289CAEB1|nr:prolipoprotein diacylglyceryl transferase [Sedimentibacter sp.]
MNRFVFENLFGIEGFNIAWYGVIIASGLFLGTLLAMRRTKQRYFNPDIILDFLLLAIPLAIAGARLYYVAFEWESYADNLLQVFAINQGGLAIYGGVIGGIIAAKIFCKIKKFPFLTLIDLVVPSMILGQAIGRWGNFVNQEAFGNIITNPSLQFFPVSVYIEQLGEWHQATFFYESAWNIVLLCVVLLLSRRKVKDGTLLSTYFVGYGIGRFLIEGLRTDSLYIIPGVRVSQILSLLLIAIGVVVLILIHKGKLKTPSYEGKYLL